MLRVGLTGGIATGKSQVLRRLASHGFCTLDLDVVAHEVMAAGSPAHAEVVAAFGPRILAADGQIDRKALGAIVFADAASRERLNAIVHPRVLSEERARTAGAPAEVAVTDGALLVEAGVHLRYDRLVVVHCDPARQLRRLRERDGLSEEAAQARIDAQMPLPEKRRFAHYDVDTSGTLEDSLAAADRLAEALRALLPRPPAVSVPLERAAGGLVHGPSTGPRGLTPPDLLSVIAEAQAVEMLRIAGRLVPSPAGPWYRAGEPRGPGPGAETLLVPLVLFSLARAGSDPPFLVAGAASLARLFHSEDAPVSDACLLALALQEVAMSGSVPPDLAERVESQRPLAQRWGGSAPTARAFGALSAAAAHPADPEAASRATPEGRSSLAGALVGLAVGAAPVPPSIRASLEALSMVR